jgi:hypothetical protein
MYFLRLKKTLRIQATIQIPKHLAKFGYRERTFSIYAVSFSGPVGPGSTQEPAVVEENRPARPTGS